MKTVGIGCIKESKAIIPPEKAKYTPLKNVLSLSLRQLITQGIGKCFIIFYLYNILE